MSHHQVVVWVGDPPNVTAIPPLPGAYIARPRLDDGVGAILQHRLTCVVAERGYGKSTLLASLARRVNSAWYSIPEDVDLPALVAGTAAAFASRVHGFPVGTIIGATVGGRDERGARAQALAGLICGAVRDQLTDVVLILDNVAHVEPETDGAVFLEALCRQAPSSLHIVLSARLEPPFGVERMRRQGDVFEINAADLAFTVDEVALLLRRCGVDLTEHVRAVHERTGGWPSAVELVAQLLSGTEPRDRSDRLRAVLDHDVDLYTHLAEHVLDRAGPEAIRVIRTAARVGGVTSALCEMLGLDRPAETLRSLDTRGLLIERSPQSGWFELSALIRDYVDEHFGQDASDVTEDLKITSDWFERHGHPKRAVESALRAGDARQLAALIRRHGTRLLASRDATILLAAADTLADEDVDEGTARLLGDASLMRAKLDDAAAWYDRAGADRPTLTADIAWRAAMPLIARSALPAAREVLERAVIDGTDEREAAFLLAWRSYVRRALGDAAGSDEDAESALVFAEIADDDLALTAGRTMCGLAAVSRGEPSSAQEHWREAVAHAERAGDALWIMRVRTFRATQYVSLDRHADALAEIDIILDLAEATGLNDVRAQAFALRASVRFVQGALDEAIVDLRRAIDLYEALGAALGIGPALTAGPWRTLGDVLRTRGTLIAARDAYERSVAAAESGASVVSKAMCLAGLARCIADDEPGTAATYVETATSSDAGAASAYVCVAASAVALAAGDASSATKHAHRAAALATTDDDRAGRAWAAEALAAVDTDPEGKKRLLYEALAIWQEIGAPVEAARASIALAAQLPPAEAYPMAQSAEATLRRAGARRLAASAAALVRRIDLEDQPPVHIRTLGGFSVVRYGKEVPVSEWQSRKARDLLKHLVVRRGSAMTREALVDALWPDEDPAKTANRLSVALSTVRGVMDPQKRFPADHFIRADNSSVALVLDHVSVDLERLLADAVRGLRLLGDRPDDAARLLTTAEERYAGDFLEEDAYEEWAVTLREHARTTYVEVAHALADRSAIEGDDGSVVRLSLRILERDPYDERAHLQLVGSLERAGHHGEARRCYRAYCQKMDEIGVESSAFPSAPASAATGP